MIQIPDEFIYQLTPRDFLESCHEAFVGYGNGTHKMQPRTEEITENYRSGLDRFVLKMPAEIPEGTGLKEIDELSDVSTGRIHSKKAVIRFMPFNGEEAEMNAEYITNMRTGAAGALGIRYFAPYAKTVSILGTGHIAKALALCVNELGVKRISVYSRKPENRQQFKDELQDTIQAEIVLYESQPLCIEDCDAIFTAVPTPIPIISYADIKCPYISCMGGDSRTSQLGKDVLFNANMVPDNIEQCMKSGEFKSLSKDEIEEIMFAQIGGRTANIGDAANGRLHLDGLVVGYFTGLAVQDISAAKMAYERFVKGL